MKVTIRNAFDQANNQPSLQIVIDVFRASTTSISLMDKNVDKVVVANNIETVKKLHDLGFKVVSEVFDFGIDNSPTLILQDSFLEKNVVLKTTNLTTAIEANFSDALMIIAAFNNLHAISTFVNNSDFDWVEIIPAGYMDISEATPEDTECAQLLKSLLLSEDYRPDWNKINKKVELKLSQKQWPQYFIDDLEYAIKLNLSSKVPVVSRNDESSFLLTCMQ